MKHYGVLALTLCIYLSFSCAEETKERTILDPYLESQPNNRCPDGRQCPIQKCCPKEGGGYNCCPWGRRAVCCTNRRTCCPLGWKCSGTAQCVQRTYSSVLEVQAAVLVNSTDKRCRDGKAGMDLKAARNVPPSQQVENSLTTNGFIDTSSHVSPADEKYQCPDGTSTCELSSGRDGCCPIQNARWIKIMDNFPHPRSSEDADAGAEDSRP